MKKRQSTTDEKEVWTLLSQTQHVLERVRDKELAEVGLSAIQVEVLTFLKTSKGPVNPAQLSRQLFREPHTISGLLTRMEKQGLVKRIKDMQRKNWVRIVLTTKGEAAYRKQQQIEEKAISDSLSCLSEKERDVLAVLLQRVRVAGLEELRQRQRLPFG